MATRKRQGGRPPKPASWRVRNKFTVSLTDEDLRGLKRIAFAQKMEASVLVRQWIREHIAAHEEGT